MLYRGFDQQLKSLPVLLVALLLFVPIPSFASIPGQTEEHTHGRHDEEYKEVTVRGRVVALDGSANPPAPTTDGENQKVKLAFRATDGQLFSFWSEDTAGGMLADSRVNKDQIQLTARLHLNNQLETIRVQVVREGKLYDVYYFCQLCNITAYAPGPCPCCYQDFEFIERPATDR